MNNPIEIDGSSQFFRDLENKDGHTVNKGLYNLMISKRELMLYSIGVKPHRHWKFKDVKTYFGMNGNAETMLYKLDKLYEILTTNKENK